MLYQLSYTRPFQNFKIEIKDLLVQGAGFEPA